jgi:hypothetical protein
MVKKINNRLDRFILSYSGNKYNETKKQNIFDEIPDINIYDYICEPFCGIFGFSRAIAEKYTEYKGRFILNDINGFIINLYRKLSTDEGYNEIINEIKEIINDYKNKEDIDLSKYMRTLKDKSYLPYVFRGANENVFKVSSGETKIRNFIEKQDIYKMFFSKCEFLNFDIKELVIYMEEHYPNKKILYFHDPPYFNSSNISYNMPSDSIENNFSYRTDNTILYIDILEEFKKKNDCIMILNKIELINYIFKEYIGREYGKTYQNHAGTANKKKTRKNATIHIIYKNFDNII